ncbi:response regulator [Rhodoferax sp. 4810]|nr:response regulator [Rhodoferax jenense]
MDDDHFNLEIAQCTLGGCGVRVTTASSGFEALEALNAGRFDCVFMDFQMPVMDGIETTMKIRASSRFSSTCVIGLTSNTSPRDRERYLCAGMNDVVGKPYRVEQLIDALVRNLDLN